MKQLKFMILLGVSLLISKDVNSDSAVHISSPDIATEYYKEKFKQNMDVIEFRHVKHLEYLQNNEK